MAKFKIGDKIHYKNSTSIYEIIAINPIEGYSVANTFDNFIHYGQSINSIDKDFKLIEEDFEEPPPEPVVIYEPKFKVNDRIIRKSDKTIIFRVLEIKSDIKSYTLIRIPSGKISKYNMFKVVDQNYELKVSPGHLRTKIFC